MTGRKDSIEPAALDRSVARLGRRTRKLTQKKDEFAHALETYDACDPRAFGRRRRIA